MDLPPSPINLLPHDFNFHEGGRSQDAKPEPRKKRRTTSGCMGVTCSGCALCLLHQSLCDLSVLSFYLPVPSASALDRKPAAWGSLALAVPCAFCTSCSLCLSVPSALDRKPSGGHLLWLCLLHALAVLSACAFCTRSQAHCAWVTCSGCAPSTSTPVARWSLYQLCVVALH
jgi:hypothetical protein